MNLQQRILRLGLAALLLVGLGACTVVPTYPAYGYPGTTIYYQSGHRHYDSYGSRHHHGGPHYNHGRHGAMPLPPPMRLHRDIRRNLGLPRPPGFR